MQEVANGGNSVPVLPEGKYTARITDVWREPDARFNPPPIQWRLEIVKGVYSGTFIERATYMHTPASQSFTLRELERLGLTVRGGINFERFRGLLIDVLVLVEVRHGADGRPNYYILERLPDAPSAGGDEVIDLEFSL